MPKRTAAPASTAIPSSPIPPTNCLFTKQWGHASCSDGEVNQLLTYADHIDVIRLDFEPL